MKFINKSESPQAFEDWKEHSQPNIWSDLPSSKILDERREENIVYYSKEELRSELINEQGYICGYCQDEIKNDHTSKIEHIKARGREEYRRFTFDYNNLILCCRGVKAIPPPIERHCDTYRNNEDLLVTPLVVNCQSHFRYADNGNIYHLTVEGQDTINKLNLDTPKLINRRKEVIEGWLPFDVEFSYADLNEIKQLLELRREDNSFEPFCQVIKEILNV